MSKVRPPRDGVGWYPSSVQRYGRWSWDGTPSFYPNPIAWDCSPCWVMVLGSCSWVGEKQGSVDPSILSDPPGGVRKENETYIASIPPLPPGTIDAAEGPRHARRRHRNRTSRSGIGDPQAGRRREGYQGVQEGWTRGTGGSARVRFSSCGSFQRTPERLDWIDVDDSTRIQH